MSVVVLDTSAVIAVLAEEGADAEWADAVMRSSDCAAPAAMPFEAGEVLRRRGRAGQLDASAATLAHGQLLTMRVDLWSHPLVASRAWQLRDTLTYTDGCFVALAELLDVPLVTLDRRLTRSPGPRCAFLTPPEGP